MRRVHFVSLGCARNLVDSEIMAGSLLQEGYEISHEPSEAELIIVNTCGFIDAAKTESVDSILEAGQYKDPSRGVCKSLVVTGCLSERYAEELKESLPEVDLITGSAAFSKIVDKLKLIYGNQKSKSTQVSVGEERERDYDLPRLNSGPAYTAYLKLAEGCAKRCSFCIIPKLRGKLRSRSMEALVKEAQGLVDGGVRELNLIAQDLTDYGRDRSDGASLAKLLKKLAKIEKLEWLRLFYTYPDQLSDEVISIIATEDKICKYLDIPIQHVDDEILRAMNRHTTGDQIEEMLLKLKREVPGIVLRTSLMVGFPGETKKHFERLKQFVAKGLLDHIGVFTYSHEEGTPSFQFEDTVSQEEKVRRQEELFAIQSRLQETKLKEHIGKKIRCLVEGPHPETELLLSARHQGQAPEIDNRTIINDGHASLGHFVTVQINEVVGGDLCGEILSEQL